MKTRIIPLKELTMDMRMDGSFHNAEVNVYNSVFTKHSDYNLQHYCSEIFTSGRTKRVYTLPEYGYPFLSNSEAITCDPFYFCKYSSKKNGSEEKAFLKKGMIITGRVGAIGQTIYVPSFWEKNKAMGSDNIIRIVVNEGSCSGYIYAYLASKIGKLAFEKLGTGGLQSFVTDKMVGTIPIPDLPLSIQKSIHNLIEEVSDLRSEHYSLLQEAQTLLQKGTELPKLDPDLYDYYGPRSFERKPSCFVINKKQINSITIDAFNYSSRIKRLKDTILCPTKCLKEVIENNTFFSTGSFPRIEVEKGYGIKLINQSDVFDTVITGKNISKRKVNTKNLVNYGEVMIAGVGTLGENETFCRAIFAGEELEGQLVSGEFIRMKTTDDIPSGYLYAWLSSDYGFRLIRNTRTGTKLCRPIQSLLLDIPVPIIERTIMLEIDKCVREAYSKQYEANKKELRAIKMVEDEIDKWNKK